MDAPDEATAARAALDARLIAAHEDGDAGALSALYAEAAETVFAEGHDEAGYFYLTHAYVMALEAGLPEAARYNLRLARAGRDELQGDLGPDPQADTF
jgi:hypothetical protein